MKNTKSVMPGLEDKTYLSGAKHFMSSSYALFVKF